MNSRPEGDTRKDRRARVYLMFGIIVLLLSVTGNVGLGYLNLKSQDNHHASTIKKDDIIITILREHSATLTEVASLQKEVSALVATGVPDIVNAARILETDLTDLCRANNLSCPGPSSVP